MWNIHNFGNRNKFIVRYQYKLYFNNLFNSFDYHKLVHFFLSDILSFNIIYRGIRKKC